MKYLLKIIFAFAFASSCSYLVKSQMDENDITVINNQNPATLAIIFSHNISGQLLSCGCGTNPVGGLPQLAGLIEKIKRENDQIIYLDSGDTLFSIPTVPEHIKTSSTFTAEFVASTLKDLGLNIFVPGDYDFANGEYYLKSITDKYNVNILLSNLNRSSVIKSSKYKLLDLGISKIFFISILNPELSYTASHLLDDPIKSIKLSISEIKSVGYDPNNPFHRLILLSHSGMDYDKNIASKFPEINWIIGAHTQNSTGHPYQVGNTKIVQALSKNQYLGEIQIELNKDKFSDSFKLHEIRDKFQNQLIPNPYIKIENEYKKNLKKAESEDWNRSMNQP